MSRRLARAFCVLFLGLTLFFGMKLWGLRSLYRAGSEEYDRIVESYVQEAVAPELLAEQGETAPIRVSFPELREKYPDVVAWLYCEGTEINYPVVQAKDNDFYLRKSPDGSDNYGGSIFLDCGNAEDLSDGNSILYGHNMKDGSMFGGLIRYQRQEYYDEHPRWYLLTPEGDYRVELLGGFRTSGDDELTYSIAPTAEERDQLIRKLRANSTFQADVPVDDRDRFVTFSTCTYDSDRDRYVLVGVLGD